MPPIRLALQCSVGLLCAWPIVMITFFDDATFVQQGSKLVKVVCPPYDHAYSSPQVDRAVTTIIGAIGGFVVIHVSVFMLREALRSKNVSPWESTSPHAAPNCSHTECKENSSPVLLRRNTAWLYGSTVGFLAWNFRFHHSFLLYHGKALVVSPSYRGSDRLLSQVFVGTALMFIGSLWLLSSFACL